jgi:hypothetical protein
MVQPVYADSVFINCPFDVEYQDLFYSIIFVVQDCGFWPRCALKVAERYRDFLDSLPNYFDRFGLTAEELIFTDFRKLVTEWLKINGR